MASASPVFGVPSLWTNVPSANGSWTELKPQPVTRSARLRACDLDQRCGEECFTAWKLIHPLAEDQRPPARALRLATAAPPGVVRAGIRASLLACSRLAGTAPQTAPIRSPPAATLSIGALHSGCIRLRRSPSDSVTGVYSSFLSFWDPPGEERQMTNRQALPAITCPRRHGHGR